MTGGGALVKPNKYAAKRQNKYVNQGFALRDFISKNIISENLALSIYLPKKTQKHAKITAFYACFNILCVF